MRCVKRVRFCAVAAGLLAAAWGSGQARAATVYSQAPTNLGLGYSSQNDTASGGFGAFATGYDNFTLGASATINKVNWFGEFFSGPPSHGTITAFTVQVYADNAGQPGTSLYSATIPGAANETFVGTFGGLDQFSYSGAVSFAATGGTQYWLSVVADADYPPIWGWETSVGGNLLSYQDASGVRSLIAGDLAFSLEAADPATGGSAVPLPASVYGAIPGLAALVLRRRGRR
jgi:hypothetical protein